MLTVVEHTAIPTRLLYLAYMKLVDDIHELFGEDTRTSSMLFHIYYTSGMRYCNLFFVDVPLLIIFDWSLNTKNVTAVRYTSSLTLNQQEKLTDALQLLCEVPQLKDMVINEDGNAHSVVMNLPSLIELSGQELS